MAQNDSKTSVNTNEAQAAAEKTQAESALAKGGIIPAKINVDTLKANVRAAKDADNIPGVHVLESGRHDKTSIVCGKQNIFIEGKRVTILVIEE